MDLNYIRVRHQADHYNSPQNCEAIRLAVDSVSGGLATLARLGHPYHLEPGVLHPPDEWPKTMFHAEAAPNGRLVRSEYEARELGAGWFFTLQDAQHWDGVRAQFAGRGGVGHENVPMLVGVRGPQPEMQHKNDNSALIELWKKVNGVKKNGDEH